MPKVTTQTTLLGHYFDGPQRSSFVSAEPWLSRLSWGKKVYMCQCWDRRDYGAPDLTTEHDTYEEAALVAVAWVTE